MAELVSAKQRAWQFGATMFVAFGVLALLVAAIGLHGVIGYDVAQRMHELGVRVALGAQSRDLLRLVMRQGLQLTAIGIVCGGVAAWAVAGPLQLLFEQSARDRWVFGQVAAVLLLAAIVATVVSARRAGRADPNSALRGD